ANGKVEHIDLAPLDVISFPPGAIRRFENVSKGSKRKHATLMFVIAGDQPQAEFSKEAMAVLDAAGLLADGLVHKGKTVSSGHSQAPTPRPRTAMPKAAPVTRKKATRGA
ncbi:MAG: hypothetical protein ACREXT_16380, partial [Gammaproteobacteria bacterium]